MDYHGRIMNIEVDVASMAAAGKPRSLRFAFKAGHRDARHAAAEIANEAQREIDVLSEANGHQDQMICDQAAEIERLHSGAVDMLNWKDRTIADYKSERDEAQAEIARLREALGTFMEWWDTESAGPQYSSPLGRDGFDGEREWRAWWDNQLRLAALAPELGRAALAQVAEVPK